MLRAYDSAGAEVALDIGGLAWTAYTPTWTATTTNPAIGNGTIVGAYVQIGKTVHARVTITMGSTTTYGTGNWMISLPVAAKASIRFSGHLESVDTSAASSVTGRVTGLGSVAYPVASPLTAGGYDRPMTSTVPIPWANTDVLSMVITYEAA